MMQQQLAVIVKTMQVRPEPLKVTARFVGGDMVSQLEVQGTWEQGLLVKNSEGNTLLLNLNNATIVEFI